LRFDFLNRKEMETIKTPKKTANSLNGALTFRQIRNRVGDGWAIILDPEFNGSIFLKGKLLFHSLNKEEAVEEYCKRDENHLYLKYCGKRDPNLVYLL
jgi:hypothetical protein